jgi:RNA polymerase sigma-70 factor (ECF subfamily)
MLGSFSEADDAIQEAGWKVSRSDAGEIEDPGGWLTTVGAGESPNIVGGRTQPLGARLAWG